MRRSAPRAPKTVAIIGTGLIGTSIGMALRARARGAPIVVGWDRNRASLAASRRKGGLTRAAPSLEDAVSDADVVVIAAPLDAVITLVARVVRGAKRGALVIDVVGVKAPVVAAARRAIRRRDGVSFVSGHPMAGRELAGAANAERALFAGRPFALVVPAQPQRKRALARAAQFARSLKAAPLLLSAHEHDRIVAASSALPQLSSIALAIAVDRASNGRARRLAGPGYADASRLAVSPYHVWAPVLLASRPAIVRALRHLERAVRSLAAAARRPDDRAMERLFLRAAAARRRVVADRGKK